MADISLNVKADARGAITGIDQVTGSLTKMEKEAKTAQSSLDGLLRGVFAGASFAGALAAIDRMLKAQAEQEAAINKLNLALANQGRFTEGTSKALIEYAAALQKTSTYADEVIIAAEAQLARFGLNEEQIKKTTKAAMDYAAFTGTDLISAVELLGKAFQGHTERLARQGIVVDQNLPRLERFRAVLDQVQGVMGGAAATATENYLGRLAQMKNALNDVEEAAGRFLAALGDFGGKGGTGLAVLEGITKFIGHDMVLGLGFIRGGMLEFFAIIYEQIAKLEGFSKAHPLLARLFGVPTGAVAGAGDMAKGLHQQALEVMHEAETAANSMGKIAGVKNAAGPVKVFEQITQAAKEARVMVTEFHRDFEAMLAPGGAEFMSGSTLTIPDKAKEDLKDYAKTLQADIVPAGASYADAMEQWHKRFDAVNEAARKTVSIHTEWKNGLPVIVKNIETAEQRQRRLADNAERWAMAMQGVATLAAMIGGSFGNLLLALPQIAEATKKLSQSWGTMRAGDKIAGIGGIASMLGGLLGPGSALGRALQGGGAGAQIGNQIGSIFGPMGSLIGSIGGGLVGALVGLFHKPAWKKAAEEAGKILGHGISQSMAEEILRRSKETGKSVTRIAQEMKVEEMFAGKAEARSKLEEGLRSAAEYAAQLLGQVGIFNNSALSQAAANLADKVRSAMLANGLGFMVAGTPLANSEAFKAVQAAAGSTAGVVGGMAKAGMVDTGLTAAAGSAAQQLYNEAVNAATQAGLPATEASKAGFGAISQLLQTQLNASIQSGQKLDANTQALLDQAKAQGLEILPGVAEQQLQALKAIEVNTSGRGTATSKASERAPEYTAARGFGFAKLSQDTIIQAHQGEHVMIVPRGRRVAFRSALRGLTAEGDYVPGGETGGGGTTTTEPTTTTSKEVAAQVAADTTKAIEAAVAKIAKPISFAPVVQINNDPFATRERREDADKAAVDSAVKAINQRLPAFILALERAGFSRRG